MSTSFQYQQETVRNTANNIMPGARGMGGGGGGGGGGGNGNSGGPAHKLGEALTGGKSQTGYLAVRSASP